MKLIQQIMIKAMGDIDAPLWKEAMWDIVHVL